MEKSLSKQIEIVPPASLVVLGTKDGPVARVVEVCIRDENVIQYKCAWWSGNERKCEWVESSEIFVKHDQSYRTIGFKA